MFSGEYSIVVFIEQYIFTISLVQSVCIPITSVIFTYSIWPFYRDYTTFWLPRKFLCARIELVLFLSSKTINGTMCFSFFTNLQWKPENCGVGCYINPQVYLILLQRNTCYCLLVKSLIKSNVCITSQLLQPHVHWPIYSLKVPFLFQSFLVITVLWFLECQDSFTILEPRELQINCFILQIGYRQYSQVV